ncbi:MAG: MliC family protein [Proteobacteria bacterium]|nr:MliC family protein [Pseudomonadota bacterium]
MSIQNVLRPVSSLLFIGLCALQLSACSTETEREEAVAVPADSQPVGKTLVYECTGYEFIARTGPGEMAVWLEDRYLVMSREYSASGEKYVEGDVTFWSKGEEALLIIDNQKFGDCKLAPHRVPWEDARRRGVDFRAVGNEPGWTLEIRHDHHILFVGDYGMNRVLFPSPTQSTEGALTVYAASNDKLQLKVEILDELCTDTMKGDTFTSQVAVYLGDNTFTGCGNSLFSPWK